MIGSLRKLIATLTLASLAAPVLAYAADAPRDIPLAVSILGHGAVSGLAQYIGLVYQYAIGVAGMFAVILIMYGGMKWIFAAGDSSKISAAKDTIVHAVVGLIIALGSYVILNTINPALVNLEVPNIKKIGLIKMVGRECPNEGEFAGRYACGQLYDLNDSEGVAGRCRGISCGADQGGCFGYQKGDETVYKCLSPAPCPSSCDGISSQIQGSDFIVYCQSSICKDKIPGLCYLDPNYYCQSRYKEGKWGCNKNNECEPGLWCVTAQGINSCERQPTENLPNETDCDLNIPKACGPTSKCIDTSGPDGDCSNGEKGAPCGSTGDCQSGLRCHDCRGPQEDDKCGPPSTSSTCFRYSLNCDSDKRAAGNCFVD